MGSAPPVRASRRWRRRCLRLLALVALCYLGIILYLLYQEDRLVYQPTPASVSWRPPEAPDVRDVELATPRGARVHAWWGPAPGARGALLYWHGNGGKPRKWARDVGVVPKRARRAGAVFEQP